ncbi:hypothetical protein MJD09_13410 [bacterium]|nr:hypothetical protein [bacterium]
MIYDSLAYDSPKEMLFGKAIHPVSCGFDLVLGDGLVFPEVNFTLPIMPVNEGNRTAILKQYEEMVSTVLNRLAILQVPGAVIEFEHAPQMTEYLDIGADITAQTKQLMDDYYQKHKLKTALRATICDIREKERPPKMRTGETVERIFESFRLSAVRGADLLSIESTGGKEVSDRALIEASLPGLLLSLGILAPRDMHFLWNGINNIATGENVIAAGDSACAFANTAMILADQRYIPNVLAAVVRAMSAVRSLVAFEEGAIGPSKDCAYEGPVIKAITGYPISMEGKSAACAHFSHVGNIAMAVADLWSNESVQNVKLLSGFAPEVFAEVLAYDCRLMNEAVVEGDEEIIRKLLIKSDEYRSVHALIISPDSSYKIAEAIVGEKSDFERTRQAGLATCRIIEAAIEENILTLPDREITYLNRFQDELAKYSSEEMVLEAAFLDYKDLFVASEYGLEAP